MRKIVIHRAGGYGELHIEEHPDPVPAAGEVAVSVEAAGVNYADCLVRMGLYQSARDFVGWPITPGFEFAGTVVGSGERVLGVARFGAYATRVCVPRHQLFPIPPGLDAAQAAGFPCIFLTAYYPLFELMTVRPGMKYLIHSAAGGVGSALIQLAKIAGGFVVGVVGGAHKVEAARSLGADAVIDKSGGDLWGEAGRLAPDGYDIVLDANGPETLRESYRHLASAGRLVVYGFHGMMPRVGGRPRWLKLAWDWLRTPRFDPLRMTTENRSVLAFNLSYLFHRKELLVEGMARLLAWAGEGKIRLPAVASYPLEKVSEAHQALESGRTVGKLVLRMDGSS